MFVADFVPFSISAIDTDIIFPREQGASRFLIRNWPPIRSLEGDTMWVHGKWARIGFFTVSDAPPTFVAEASPFAHPDAPSQVLTLSLNDEHVDSVPMPPGWQTYEFELPAELVHVGWNEIELEFAQTLRPADFDPSSNDRRTLAAEFRRIEMRGADGRPHWAQRPEQVELREEPGQATAIDMPAGSYVETYLIAGDEARLVGSVEADFEEQDGGALRAVVDALAPGSTTPIWSADLTPGASTAEVAADLSSFADQVVGLRLRVFGGANGVVSWKELGVAQSTAAQDVPALPGEIVAPPASGALGRPDVFLIILDAARADRFSGALGAELAPNVRALAADGTEFSRAWAPSSWTGQTIPAIWTGMAPDAVGIEHWGSRLSAELTTFPELFFEAGYNTRLWSQHNIYRARRALRNGFEVFEHVDSTKLEDRELLPAIGDLVDGEKPTFAVIHLLPPHGPYRPPEPFGGSRSSWYEGDRITANRLHLFDTFYADDQVAERDEVRRAALAMYEENISFADHLVGRLVDDLKRRGRYDDALIIVTSDHGEAFYEHGRFLHTNLVYEEFLRVPLVVKWPRSYEDFVPVVDTPVSLVDIAPTLIDGVGIVSDEARYQGLSFLRLAAGEPAPNRVLYAYTSGQTDPELESKGQSTVLWGDVKLIRDEVYDRAVLFDLGEDADEKVDLSAENFYTAWLTQTLRQIRAHNAGFLLELGGASVEELDAETVRRLRALGYLR